MMEISIVKLKDVVEGLLGWVRQDLIANQATPTQSWLYLEFNDITLDDTHFYTQLKSLIEIGESDRRHLEVRLMFDKERANLPTIHIHYPNEDGKSGDNTLNTGYTITEVIGDNNVLLYSRSFIGQYDLVITGAGSVEVIMLYEFLDGLLIAAADTLAYNFDKFEFSGKQLMTNQEIIPYLTFYRAISINLQRKKIVHSLLRKRQATDVQFLGQYYTDSQEPTAQTVSVLIAASATSVHVNDTVTFTATPTNGGTTPGYMWFVNNTEVPDETASTFDLTAIGVGSVIVRCEVLSSILYLPPRPAVSNNITITVTA